MTKALRILVIDNDTALREVVAARLRATGGVEVVTAALDDDLIDLLKKPTSLVISDVQDSETQGFWLHRYLADTKPSSPLILFVSPHRSLRNIPTNDRTLISAVLKPDVEKLMKVISMIGGFLD